MFFDGYFFRGAILQETRKQKLKWIHEMKQKIRHIFDENTTYMLFVANE